MKGVQFCMGILIIEDCQQGSWMGIFKNAFHSCLGIFNTLNATSLDLSWLMEYSRLSIVKLSTEFMHTPDCQ